MYHVTYFDTNKMIAKMMPKIAQNKNYSVLSVENWGEGKEEFTTIIFANENERDEFISTFSAGQGQVADKGAWEVD